MITSKARLYGTLELTQQWFLFSVFKTDGSRIIPLFKREIEGQSPWLDENDQVQNLNGTALKLTEVTQEFHQAFPQYKLTKIALILPTTHLQIREVTKTINLNEPQKSSTITSLTLEKITNLEDENDANFVALDNKILHYIVDDKIYDREQLLGLEAKDLMIKSLIYEIPKSIIISFQRLLNLANLDCLWMTTSLQALYRNFNSKEQDRLQPLVLTNWKEENLEIGFFEGGWLKKVVIVPQGFHFIEKNLEQQFGLPKKVLARYLFKVVDYQNLNLANQTNICGVWDQRQKVLKKYSLKNVQEIIGREFQKLYIFGLKQLFAQTILPTNLITYHCGIMTKIVGIDKLLGIINHLPHYNFRVIILGWGLNHRFHTAFGLVKALEKINNYAPHPKIYTSQGSYLKKTPTSVEEQNYYQNKTISDLNYVKA